MTVSFATIVQRWLEGDPRPADPRPAETIAARVRAVQINAIARNSPMVMLAAIFNAIVLRIGLDRVSGPFLNIWTALVIGLSGLLFLRHVLRPQEPRPLSASKRGIRRAVAHGAIFGVLWAAIPFMYFPGALRDEQLIITCVSIGMVFGGAFTLAAVPVAAFAFMIPIAVGTAHAISSLGPGTYPLIAGLLVVYTAVVLTAGAGYAALLGTRVINHVADEEAARKDFLTGLPNRLAFRSYLSARLNATHDATTLRLALFYFDLDHFKTINDRMGHEAGDLILIQTAQRLREATRHSDFIARLGGDEFVLVAESFVSDGTVRQLAERINEVFRVPFDILGEEVSSTITIGVAFVPEAGTDYDLILRHADAALYAAKNTTRGSYAVWQPGSGQPVVEKRYALPRQDIGGSMAHEPHSLQQY